jgi:hypothetical protein
MTEGMHTTEFWLSITVIVSALALSLTGNVSGEIALGAIAATGAGYSVGRGLAK